MLPVLKNTIEGKPVARQDIEKMTTTKNEMVAQIKKLVKNSTSDRLALFVIGKRLEEIAKTLTGETKSDAIRLTQDLFEEGKKTATVGIHKLTISETINYSMIPDEHIKRLLQEKEKLEKQMRPIQHKLNQYVEDIASIDRQIKKRKEEMIKENSPFIKKDDEQPQPTLKLTY